MTENHRGFHIKYNQDSEEFEWNMDGIKHSNKNLKLVRDKITKYLEWKAQPCILYVCDEDGIEFKNGTGYLKNNQGNMFQFIDDSGTYNTYISDYIYEDSDHNRETMKLIESKQNEINKLNEEIDELHCTLIKLF